MKAVENAKKVLVYGDFMIDSWRTVMPTKVSPEAPVLVTKHRRREATPGGAGNAAVNCAHLGAKVTAIGLVQGDGTEQIHALQHHGIATAFVRDQNWVNIVKERVIDTEGRHILRIDTEELDYAMDDHTASQLRSTFIRGITESDVLFISDYGKGTINGRVFHGVVTHATFVIANGKPENLHLYNWADCLVINKSEAMLIAHAFDPMLTPCDLADDVVEKGDFKGMHLIITDGANGLYWFVRGHGPRHIKAPQVSVADVAGAGDTICAAIATHGKVDESVLLYAVEAAALVVSQHGTAVPTLEK